MRKLKMALVALLAATLLIGTSQVAHADLWGVVYDLIDDVKPE